jgi:hypothetical protein
MENIPTENKKGFLQNDRLLVCGLLAFYGCCMIGFFGTALWLLNQKSQRISASATSTAAVYATRWSQSTATAVAHATELAQYELIDRFDSNKNQWQTGPLLGIDWKGTPQIESGVFVWDIEEVYDSQAMISMEFDPVNNYVKNYDTYVDTKFSAVPPSGLACSGLIFRQAPLGWNTGGYSFSICSAGFYGIYYHNARDGWQEIDAQYHPSIRRYDWNRLEVLVNDSHFTFLINSQVVYETEDDRQPVGGVALMVEVQEDGTQILFDNFGFQSR